ncbi:Alfin protein [Raphanus sativus]|nr:Alfin protein [Raphanus sativus]
MGVTFMISRTGRKFRPKFQAIVGDAASGFSESSLFHVSPDHEVSFVLSLYPNGYSIGKPSEAVQQTSFRDAPKVLHPYDRAAEADENLHLYGLPNGSWEVDLPVDEVPPELPEPALDINFARDGMAEKNWVSLIAVHSDSWLISAAFYIASSILQVPELVSSFQRRLCNFVEK